jgi:hypothetical protein
MKQTEAFKIFEEKKVRIVWDDESGTYQPYILTAP